MIRVPLGKNGKISPDSGAQVGRAVSSISIPLYLIKIACTPDSTAIHAGLHIGAVLPLLRLALLYY